MFHIFLNKTAFPYCMVASDGLPLSQKTTEVPSVLGKYLNNAVQVLEKFAGSIVPHEETSKLVTLLEDVKSIDEPNVIAIADTVRYMSRFNALVRDNVGNMTFADRYNDITEMFTSIREDVKTMIGHMEDGKIDYKEKMWNVWMKLNRGTPHKRFEKIIKIYNAVSDDTKKQIDKENAIIEAYVDFRMALKAAEKIAYDVYNKQRVNLDKARETYDLASKTMGDYKDNDEAVKADLQLKRDEAKRAFDSEDKKYQLIKDVAEDMKTGYNVGETLVGKLSQTHGLKEQVYRRSISFFTTNEHVFTTLDAVYTSQFGLHEATETLEAMKDGANKGLEDIAQIGGELEKAALKAGYGSTLNPQSVQKLVDAVVNFQEESVKLISEYREESRKSTQEIEKIVEDGKKRHADAVMKYLPAA